MFYENNGKLSAEEKKAIIDFMETQPYSEEKIKIWKTYLDFFDRDQTLRTSFFTSMMAEIGMLKKNQNHYLKIIECLKETVGIDKNIVDIGPGHYPYTSLRIKEYQAAIGKGTLMIYEPLLILTDLENERTKVMKGNFHRDTEIKEGSVLFSIAPDNDVVNAIKDQARKRRLNVVISTKLSDNDLGENTPDNIYRFLKDTSQPGDIVIQEQIPIEGAETRKVIIKKIAA